MLPLSWSPLQLGAEGCLVFVGRSCVLCVFRVDPCRASNFPQQHDAKFVTLTSCCPQAPHLALFIYFAAGLIWYSAPAASSSQTVGASSKFYALHDFGTRAFRLSTSWVRLFPLLPYAVVRMWCCRIGIVSYRTTCFLLAAMDECIATDIKSYGARVLHYLSNSGLSVIFRFRGDSSSNILCDSTCRLQHHAAASGPSIWSHRPILRMLQLWQKKANLHKRNLCLVMCLICVCRSDKPLSPFCLQL